MAPGPLNWLRFFWITSSWALRTACAVHVIKADIYDCNETRGELMLTTLQAYGDYVHELKKYKLGRGVEMGDLVVMSKPTDPDSRVCKRITGMPGDMILVDPSSSSELTYSPRDRETNEGFNRFVEVPKGHVWVTGDNLCLSMDSRSFQAVPMGLIKGKIVAANSPMKGFFNEDEKFSFLNFKWLENNFTDDS